MKEKNYSQLLPAVLTTIRVLVGWHFLYEGIIKLAADNWSAYGYLSQARWIFSDFFRWLISNPDALAVADFLNIWGLVLIGTGLILGVFTRIASAAGVLLLSMYYIASPPFLKPSFE
jgi:thiosulfate dehydrogenase [quinone] large subunit